MITPNSKIMLKQIPEVWHCKIYDKDDNEHDGVIMSDDISRNLGDFGIFAREAGDALYVAVENFNLPQGRITFSQNGNEITRRIVSVSKNPFFFVITLGEEC